MNIATKLLLASALTLTFASPSFARMETLKNNHVYMVSHGKMVDTKVDEKNLAMIKREFREMEFGTMIYVSGNKIYSAPDRKMADGKMLSTSVFGKDLGASSLQ